VCIVCVWCQWFVCMYDCVCVCVVLVVCLHVCPVLVLVCLCVCGASGMSACMSCVGVGISVSVCVCVYGASGMSACMYVSVCSGSEYRSPLKPSPRSILGSVHFALKNSLYSRFSVISVMK